jgi:hypothetical protein
MTEIFVQFKNYLIAYPVAKTGTVAYARVTAWITRYPNAKVEEITTGPVWAIKITINENVPDDLRSSS